MCRVMKNRVGILFPFLDIVASTVLISKLETGRILALNTNDQAVKLIMYLLEIWHYLLVTVSFRTAVTNSLDTVFVALQMMVPEVASKGVLNTTSSPEPETESPSTTQL